MHLAPMGILTLIIQTKHVGINLQQQTYERCRSPACSVDFDVSSWKPSCDSCDRKSDRYANREVNEVNTRLSTQRKTSHAVVNENKGEGDYSWCNKLPSANGFSGDMSSIGRVAFRSPIATPCPV